MARIKYSALVSTINGSIQGTTFQRNRYGNTVKGKPNMIRPYTIAQTAQKNAMAEITRQWRGLTELQRQDWNTYAENNPRPTRLNPDAYLSGYNFFLLVNRYRKLSDLNPIPLVSPAATQYDLGTWEFYIIANPTNLWIRTVNGVVSGDWNFMIYLTSVIPYGREYVHSTPRYIFSESWNSDDDWNITNQYLAAVGQLPVVGDWIGYKLIFIEHTNGQVIILPTTQIQVTAP